MGKLELQHEPPLVRWSLREDELKVFERGFDLKDDGDVLCLRRENVMDRDGKKVIGCALVGIPSEQAHLAKVAAAKHTPKPEAVEEAIETELTEPTTPKKARGKKEKD